jgi:hypothetical protein
VEVTMQDIPKYKYYIESLIATQVSDPDIHIGVNKENRAGLLNDDDIILINFRSFNKFYFTIMDIVSTPEDHLYQKALDKASKLYKCFKDYSYELSYDDNRNFHFYPIESRSDFVDKTEDIAYLITYYNGYTNEPLRIAKFNSLKAEMRKLNKKYGPTRARPLNITSFSTVFDF